MWRCVPAALVVASVLLLAVVWLGRMRDVWSAPTGWWSVQRGNECGVTVITFNCDRCSKRVVGQHHKSGTSGFYVVDGPTWREYALTDPEQAPEHFVCDACVRSMPLYVERYGNSRPE